MGFVGAAYYVYRCEPPLGLRTNAGPEFWKGDVDTFLEACPLGWEIGFNIVNGKPVEVARRDLLPKTKG